MENGRPVASINQRRSQRIPLAVRIPVVGKRPKGGTFSERTSTIVVSAHGALLRLEEPVQIGQVLTLKNIVTAKENTCTVVDVNKKDSETPEVGIEFRETCPRFWRVSIPPKDWNSRSPEAKRLIKPEGTVPANPTPTPPLVKKFSKQKAAILKKASIGIGLVWRFNELAHPTGRHFQRLLSEVKAMSIVRTLTAILGVLAIVAIVGLLASRLRAGDKEPAVGTAAPDFTLNSQEGKPISLHDFKGKWVVLYFYPKDGTPGCTIEAHNFQRDLSKYNAKNAVILGVSVQDEKSHQEFCAKEGLNFKLLADNNKEVSEKYDSIMNLGVTKLSARHTFLIGPDGTVRKVWNDVDVKTHSDQVLAAIEEYQKTAT